MTEFEDLSTPQDHDMLRISPNEFITFIRGESTESSVEISCICKFPVTYKIQTTSPEKFRVRPRCGLLHPGEKIAVSILLKPEHHLSDGNKDKFLVMCIPTPQGMDITQPQMIELWKQKASNSPEIEQHRLCCTYKCAGEPMRNGYGGHSGGEMFESKSISNITDLSKHAKKLESQLRFTQIMQCVSLVLLLVLSVAVVYLLKLQMDGGGGDAPAVVEPEVADFACPKGQKL